MNTCIFVTAAEDDEPQAFSGYSREPVKGQAQGQTARSHSPDMFESEGDSYHEETVGARRLSDHFEGDEGETTDYGYPMDALLREYPGYNVDVLENLLLQCNVDVDKVRDLIGS